MPAIMTADIAAVMIVRKFFSISDTPYSFFILFFNGGIVLKTASPFNHVGTSAHDFLIWA